MTWTTKTLDDGRVYEWIECVDRFSLVVHKNRFKDDSEKFAWNIHLNEWGGGRSSLAMARINPYVGRSEMDAYDTVEEAQRGAEDAFRELLKNEMDVLLGVIHENGLANSSDLI